MVTWNSVGGYKYFPKNTLILHYSSDNTQIILVLVPRFIFKHIILKPIKSMCI